MKTDRYSRLAFDEPVGPNPVTVFDGEGNIKRVIPPDVLRKHAEASADKRPPECAPRKDWFVIPTVPRRKKPKVERD